MNRDAMTLIGWTHEAANELFKAHELLDANGVPERLADSEVDLTLAGRIALALERVKETGA